MSRAEINREIKAHRFVIITEVELDVSGQTCAYVRCNRCKTNHQIEVINED